MYVIIVHTYLFIFSIVIVIMYIPIKVYSSYFCVLNYLSTKSSRSERSDFSKFKLQVANLCNLGFFFVITVLTNLLFRFS